jgi:hypothetical protein
LEGTKLYTLQLLFAEILSTKITQLKPKVEVSVGGGAIEEWCPMLTFGQAHVQKVMLYFVAELLEQEKNRCGVVLAGLDPDCYAKDVRGVDTFTMASFWTKHFQNCEVIFLHCGPCCFMIDRPYRKGSGVCMNLG